MKFSAWFFRCLLAVLLCALVNGCVPPNQSQLDDEKEPHFIEGKRALNTMDYKGAIDEFEKAVEANPRNASAHFELGILYENPNAEPDPAAAIYHYQQFLKLRPNADTAEAVQGRIMNCKQDLAKAVLPLPTSPSVQHDLEKLIEENKQLKAEVEKWRAWYSAQQTNRQVQSVTPVAQTPQANTQSVQAIEQVATVRSNSLPVAQGWNNRTPPHGQTAVSPINPRTTYVVQSRDTLASISRKFNVKLNSLMAANPGIDAKHLRLGQTVNIP
ncbi:MAG TPA: LysM peptidoglycan-binding domain-containing protein [Verrucomicrobiae bacterium]|nr:LysM peptidoglycan-binding domain-containing protein [Verrucomicrobiae bacterium]